LDVPIDASPKYRQRCLKIKDALARHGSHNSFFLYNARCVYHLVNDATEGMLELGFEGTALTDETDQKTVRVDLDVVLLRETCDWMTEPIVEWFKETTQHAVLVEFDRYIAAGDLAQTVKRIEQIQALSDESGGYMGMYL
jgi:hypothetical protein